MSCEKTCVQVNTHIEKPTLPEVAPASEVAESAASGFNPLYLTPLGALAGLPALLSSGGGGITESTFSPAAPAVPLSSAAVGDISGAVGLLLVIGLAVAKKLEAWK
jgi:hypothetical protein